VQTGPFGSQLHASDYRAYGTPIITVEHLGDNRIIHENVPLVSDDDLQRLTRYQLYAGDIVFSRVGAIDRRALVTDLEHGWLFSGRCLRVRPRRDAVHPGFLAHYLGLPHVKNWILNHSVGSTMACLNTDILLQLPLTLPPLALQLRIAAVLDTVDEAITKTGAVIAKLKQVRAGLLHDLLTRGLDEHGKLRDPIAHPEQFQGSPLGQIPKDWKVELLGARLQQNAGFVQTGPFGSQLHAHEYTHEGVPVIMPQDISAGRFVDENIARISTEKATALQRHRVKESDLIFARRGDLARCAPVTTQEVHWLCGTGCLLMRFKQYTLVPKWLSFIYRHDIGQRQIAARAVGTTMVNLNTQLLAHLAFPFPEKREQEAIVQCVDEADRAIEAEMLQLAKLNLLKSGLMTDLLTGRVRVPEEIAVAP
jgi:type I restriction enzyme S subunit